MGENENKQTMMGLPYRDRKSQCSHHRSTGTSALATTMTMRGFWRQCGVLICIVSFLLASGVLLYVSFSIQRSGMQKEIRQIIGEEPPSSSGSTTSSSSRVVVSSKPPSAQYSVSTNSTIENGVASQALNDTMENSIQHLVELKINFVALDFDLTAIDVHTGGRWKKSAEELIRHVRPEFRQLILGCLNQDIFVSIVTFTPQTDLVKIVLESIVGVERVNRIPIRGEDDTWRYHHRQVIRDESSLKGKQAHMASAVEEFTRDGKVEIAKNSMILIDDDLRNIRYASKNGIWGLWFNPDKPHDLIRDLARLE
jgi:hypothetical protein